MNFCTLFDSHYLDRGLVMYDSLAETTKNYKLYVLAMDEKCYDVLKAMQQENLIPIALSDFESDELKILKAKRTRAEYCWTCSSYLINYILENREDNCTYIDADMFFFADPTFLFEEMRANGCDVQIIEHRFGHKSLDRQLEKRSGKYCVEFNTFLKTDNALAVLHHWMRQVTEQCTDSADGKVFGDQKYLDEWPKQYSGIHIIKHLGAGVAPWNISQYRLVSKDGSPLLVHWNECDEDIPLVFYHFHNFAIVDEKTIDMGVYAQSMRLEKSLVDAIYRPYIDKLMRKRRWLEKEYSVSFPVRIEKHSSLKYVLKQKSLAKICNKLRGYNIISIAQYLWCCKNKKKDRITI